MNASVKKTVKFAAGVCAAFGVVTLGAVVASGTAVKVIVEGLKAAKDTMKQTMEELRAETKAGSDAVGAEEVAPAIAAEA